MADSQGQSLAWVHRRAGFRVEQASSSGLWNCILGERLEKLGDMASSLRPTPPEPGQANRNQYR